MISFPYFSPAKFIFLGPPSRVIKCQKNTVFAFFNKPTGLSIKQYDCVIELWKKDTKKILGIPYKQNINIVAVFRIKNKPTF